MLGSRISAVVVSVLVALGLSGVVFAGGDQKEPEANPRLEPPVFDKLIPPPGPITATMKTLGQIEPRIDANALSGDMQWMIVIDEPGSYYLTGDVKAIWGKGGIRIRAAGVTLDLNGFRVDGRDTGEGNRMGIAGGAKGVIRNGVVSNWPGPGVSASEVTLVDVLVENSASSGYAGAAISVGEYSIVRNCRVVNSGANGISAWVNSVVEDSVVVGSRMHGITIIPTGLASIVVPGVVRNCVSVGNDGVGIFASFAGQITDCLTSSNGESGFSANRGSTIENCTSFLDAVGFKLYAEVTALNCTAILSKRDGFQSGGNSTLTGCRAYNCDNGFTPSELAFPGAAKYLHCIASDNTNNGFLIDKENTTLENCYASGSPIGISLGENADRSIIDSCIVESNDAGIVCDADNTIIRNNSFMQSSALTVTGLNNLIIKNVILGGAKSVNIAPGNKDAAIVDHPDNAGPWSNLAF